LLYLTALSPVPCKFDLFLTILVLMLSDVCFLMFILFALYFRFLICFYAFISFHVSDRIVVLILLCVVCCVLHLLVLTHVVDAF